MDYPDFMAATQNCKARGWPGLGSRTELREHFSDRVEKECPRRQVFGYVAYPLFVSDNPTVKLRGMNLH